MERRTDQRKSIHRRSHSELGFLQDHLIMQPLLDPVQEDRKGDRAYSERVTKIRLLLTEVAALFCPY